MSGHPPEAEQDVFAEIYREDRWLHGAGPGSLPESTADFRAFLEAFIRGNRVRTVVDFGCGDWQYMRYVPLDGVSYLGLDVVEAVVEANRRAFASTNVRFEVCGDGPFSLPPADLLICKDVLIHWPNAMIQSFLDATRPSFRWSLFVNDDHQSLLGPNPEVNTDIDLGGFRALDLSVPPFNEPGAVALQYHGSLRRGELYWKKSVFLRVR